MIWRPRSVWVHWRSELLDELTKDCYQIAGEHQRLLLNYLFGDGCHRCLHPELRVELRFGLWKEWCRECLVGSLLDHPNSANGYWRCKNEHGLTYLDGCVGEFHRFCQRRKQSDLSLEEHRKYSVEDLVILKTIGISTAALNRWQRRNGSRRLVTKQRRHSH